MKINREGLLEHLIMLSESLNISVRLDSLEESRGGLYLLKGKRNIVINRKLSLDDKIDLLIEILKKENLSGVYMLPAVRELLEK